MPALTLDLPLQRTVRVPSLWCDVPAAELHVHTFAGEVASLHLVCGGETVALADDFRRAEASAWSWLDCPASEVIGTFGSFLAHALESDDPEARDAWVIPNVAGAADWADALTLAAEDAS